MRVGESANVDVTSAAGWVSDLRVPLDSHIPDPEAIVSPRGTEICLSCLTALEANRTEHD